MTPRVNVAAEPPQGRTSPQLVRVLGRIAALCLILVTAVRAQTQPAPAATPTPAAIPAARAAKNVAVITIRGEIDEWTVFGVNRRIDKALRDGAGAIVIELDTPGGRLDASLAICQRLKSLPIANTVAWVNPDAYSGGAIVALACREIVVSDYATMGDALPIAVDPLRGIQALPESEREKLLGPLLAEVVDSARRHGYDEMLVQGMVRRGVELWLVEHAQTGQRLFVTPEQYLLAVGSPPDRGTPVLPSATSPLDGSTGMNGPPPLPTAPAPPGAPQDPTGYIPAAPNTSDSLINDVNSTLELRGAPSTRPNLASPEHHGMYRPITYVTDGYGLITLKTPELLGFGVAAAQVNNDQELMAFFGATNLARLDETWSERFVRFLTLPVVRGLLIVVFLLALFIEMTSPGVALPGAVALLALLALLIPPVLINMAAWWTIAAILVGLLLLLLEIFVTPGFGLLGVGGIALLFAGLVGGFVFADPGRLFPDSTGSSGGLALATTTVLLSTATAIALMWLVGRHLPSLPFFDRLVLKDAEPDDAGSLLAAMAPIEGPLRVGAQGVALTALRPAGTAQFGDQIADVVSELSFIEAGTPVRVVSTGPFRTAVERLSAPPAPPAGGSPA